MLLPFTQFLPSQPAHGITLGSFVYPPPADVDVLAALDPIQIHVGGGFGSCGDPSGDTALACDVTELVADLTPTLIATSADLSPGATLLDPTTVTTVTYTITPSDGVTIYNASICHNVTADIVFEAAASTHPDAIISRTGDTLCAYAPSVALATPLDLSYTYRVPCNSTWTVPGDTSSSLPIASAHAAWAYRVVNANATAARNDSVTVYDSIGDARTIASPGPQTLRRVTVAAGTGTAVNVGGPELTVGDTLSQSLEISVSPCAVASQMSVVSVIPDGLAAPAITPTLNAPQLPAHTPFPDGTWSVDASDVGNDALANTTGTHTLSFNVTAALAALNVSTLIADGDAQVAFQTRIAARFTDASPVHNAPLLQGTRLASTSDFAFRLDHTASYTRTRSHSATVATGDIISADVYAVNNVVCGTCAAQSLGLEPDSLVTFRLTYYTPSSSYAAIDLTFVMPIPIFNVSALNTTLHLMDPSPPLASPLPPPVNHLSVGPDMGDYWRTLSNVTNNSTITPEWARAQLTFAPNHIQNAVEVSMPQLIDVPRYRPTSLDILVTFRVTPIPVPTQRRVSLVALVSEDNAANGVTVLSDLPTITTLQPRLVIAASWLAVNRTHTAHPDIPSAWARLAPSLAPHLAAFPATTHTGCALTRAAVPATPDWALLRDAPDPRITGVDARDVLLMIAVVENQGHAPAHNLAAHVLRCAACLPPSAAVPAAACAFTDTGLLPLAHQPRVRNNSIAVDLTASNVTLGPGDWLAFAWQWRLNDTLPPAADIPARVHLTQWTSTASLVLPNNDTANFVGHPLIPASQQAEEITDTSGSARTASLHIATQITARSLPGAAVAPFNTTRGETLALESTLVIPEIVLPSLDIALAATGASVLGSRVHHIGARVRLSTGSLASTATAGTFALGALSLAPHHAGPSQGNPPGAPTNVTLRVSWTLRVDAAPASAVVLRVCVTATSACTLTTLRVGGPVLALTPSLSPASQLEGHDTIRYTLEVAHAPASTANAYNLSLVHLIDDHARIAADGKPLVLWGVHPNATQPVAWAPAPGPASPLLSNGSLPVLPHNTTLTIAWTLNLNASAVRPLATYNHTLAVGYASSPGTPVSPALAHTWPVDTRPVAPAFASHIVATALDTPSQPSLELTLGERWALNLTMAPFVGRQNLTWDVDLPVAYHLAAQAWLLPSPFLGAPTPAPEAIPGPGGHTTRFRFRLPSLVVTDPLATLTVRLNATLADPSRLVPPSTGATPADATPIDLVSTAVRVYGIDRSLRQTTALEPAQTAVIRTPSALVIGAVTHNATAATLQSHDTVTLAIPLDASACASAAYHVNVTLVPPDNYELVEGSIEVTDDILGTAVVYPSTTRVLVGFAKLPAAAATSPTITARIRATDTLVEASTASLEASMVWSSAPDPSTLPAEFTATSPTPPATTLTATAATLDAARLPGTHDLAETPLPRLAVGEYVASRARLFLPAGTTNNVQLCTEVTVPAASPHLALRFLSRTTVNVPPTAVALTTPFPAASESLVASSTLARACLDFGNIRLPFAPALNTSDPLQAAITVDWELTLVDGAATASDGAPLALEVTSPARTTATLPIAAARVQGQIAVTSNASLPVDGSDTILITITVDHLAGPPDSAPMFGLSLAELLVPSQITLLDPLPPPHAMLAPGDTYTVQLLARVLPTVDLSTAATIPVTFVASWNTTRDAGDLADGWAVTESTQDTHTMVLDALDASIAFLETSLPQTSPETALAVGEVFTTAISLSFPEAAFPRGVNVTVAGDSLVPGEGRLELVACKLVSVGTQIVPASTPAASHPPTDVFHLADARNDSVLIQLPPLTRVADNLIDDRDTVVYNVTWRLYPDPGGTANVPAAPLRISVDMTTGAITSSTTRTDLSVVGPSILVTHTCQAPHRPEVDAADTLACNATATLDVAAPGASSAFDVHLTDVLALDAPGIFSLVPGSVAYAPTATAAHLWPLSDRNVSITWPEIPLGAPVAWVSFNLTTTNAVAPGAVYQDRVTVAYNSAPLAIAGAPHTRAATASAATLVSVLTVDTVTASLAATSLAETPGNEVTVGESLTLEVTVHLPEATTPLNVTCTGYPPSEWTLTRATVSHASPTLRPTNPSLTATADPHPIFVLPSLTNLPQGSHTPNANDTLSLALTWTLTDAPSPGVPVSFTCGAVGAPWGPVNAPPVVVVPVAPVTAIAAAFAPNTGIDAGRAIWANASLAHLTTSTAPTFNTSLSMAINASSGVFDPATLLASRAATVIVANTTHVRLDFATTLPGDAPLWIAVRAHITDARTPATTYTVLQATTESATAPLQAPLTRPRADAATADFATAQIQSIAFARASRYLTVPIGGCLTARLSAVLPELRFTNLNASFGSSHPALTPIAVFNVTTGASLSPAAYTATRWPQTAAFLFPSLVNWDDGRTDTANDTLALSQAWRLRDHPSLVGNATRVALAAAVAGSTQPRVLALPLDVRVTEPVLAISVSLNASSADAGDAVAVTVTVAHTPASSADAHLVRVDIPPAAHWLVDRVLCGLPRTRSVLGIAGTLTFTCPATVNVSAPIGGTSLVIAGSLAYASAAPATGHCPHDPQALRNATRSDAASLVTLDHAPDAVSVVLANATRPAGTTLRVRTTIRWREGTAPSATLVLSAAPAPASLVSLQSLGYAIVSQGGLSLSPALASPLGSAAFTLDLGTVVNAPDNAQSDADLLVVDSWWLVRAPPAETTGAKVAIGAAVSSDAATTVATHANVSLVVPRLAVFHAALARDYDAAGNVGFRATVTFGHTPASASLAAAVNLTVALPPSLAVLGGSLRLAGAPTGWTLDAGNVTSDTRVSLFLPAMPWPSPSNVTVVFFATATAAAEAATPSAFTTHLAWNASATADATAFALAPAASTSAVHPAPNITALVLESCAVARCNTTMGDTAATVVVNVTLAAGTANDAVLRLVPASREAGLFGVPTVVQPLRADPVTVSVDLDPDAPAWDIPLGALTRTDPATHASPPTLTLRIPVVVRNSPAVVAGALWRGMDARLAWQTALGVRAAPNRTTTWAHPLQVVEPAIEVAVAANATTVRDGTPVRFTVTLVHPNTAFSGADAWHVALTADLATAVLSPGAPAYTWTRVPPGGTRTWVVDARVDPSGWSYGQTLRPSAVLAWRTRPANATGVAALQTRVYTRAVNFTALTVNSPPTWSPGAPVTHITAGEDLRSAFNATAGASDPDGNLAPQSLVISQPPSVGTAYLNTSAPGVIEYRAPSDFLGPDAFAYRLCDTMHICTDVNISVDVNRERNDAPRIHVLRSGVAPGGGVDGSFGAPLPVVYGHPLPLPPSLPSPDAIPVALNVTDVDARAASLTLWIAAEAGVATLRLERVSVLAKTAVVVSADANATLVVRGNLTVVNAVLRDGIFLVADDATATVAHNTTVVFTVSDGGATGFPRALNATHTVPVTLHPVASVGSHSFVYGSALSTPPALAACTPHTFFLQARDRYANNVTEVPLNNVTLTWSPALASNLTSFTTPPAARPGLFTVTYVVPRAGTASLVDVALLSQANTATEHITRGLPPAPLSFVPGTATGARSTARLDRDRIRAGETITAEVCAFDPCGNRVLQAADAPLAAAINAVNLTASGRPWAAGPTPVAIRCRADVPLSGCRVCAFNGTLRAGVYNLSLSIGGVAVAGTPLPFTVVPTVANVTAAAAHVTVTPFDRYTGAPAAVHVDLVVDIHGNPITGSDPARTVVFTVTPIPARDPSPARIPVLAASDTGVTHTHADLGDGRYTATFNATVPPGHAGRWFRVSLATNGTQIPHATIEILAPAPRPTLRLAHIAWAPIPQVRSTLAVRNATLWCFWDTQLRHDLEARTAPLLAALPEGVSATARGGPQWMTASFNRTAHTPRLSLDAILGARVTIGTTSILRLPVTVNASFPDPVLTIALHPNTSSPGNWVVDTHNTSFVARNGSTANVDIPAAVLLPAPSACGWFKCWWWILILAALLAVCACVGMCIVLFTGVSDDHEGSHDARKDLEDIETWVAQMPSGGTRKLSPSILPPIGSKSMSTTTTSLPPPIGVHPIVTPHGNTVYLSPDHSTCSSSSIESSSDIDSTGVRMDHMGGFRTGMGSVVTADNFEMGSTQSYSETDTLPPPLEHDMPPKLSQPLPIKPMIVKRSPVQTHTMRRIHVMPPKDRRKSVPASAPSASNPVAKDPAPVPTKPMTALGARTAPATRATQQLGLGGASYVSATTPAMPPADLDGFGGFGDGDDVDDLFGF